MGTEYCDNVIEVLIWYQFAVCDEYQPAVQWSTSAKVFEWVESYVLIDSLIEKYLAKKPKSNKLLAIVLVLYDLNICLCY